MNHTPGPWRIKGTNYGYTNKDVLGPPHRDGGDYSPICTADNEANARLIAAAPELLEALKGMNHMGGDERGGYCICPRQDGSAPDERHATICVDARKAIAKAEGEKVQAETVK